MHLPRVEPGAQAWEACMLPLQVPLSRILVLENHEGEQQTCGSQKCRTCGTDMTQCLTKKVICGFEQQSLDSESRVLTVTPRDQLMETSTSFPNFYSPFLSCQETHRPRGQLLAPLLHFTGWVDRALAFSMLSENLRSEVQA